MEFPREIMDQIRDLHGIAKVEVQQLRAEAEQAAQAERIWNDFGRFLAKGWVFHVLALTKKETPRLKKMREENHPAIPSIEEAYRLAKEESGRILRRFPAIIEEACQAVDLALDSDSRHPKYNLERSFFRIEIDEKKCMVCLSNHEGRLAELPADVPAIVETIQREHQRIFGRSFNGVKFLKTLRAQYLAILKKEKQADGTSVPIRHITRRLGKNKRGFRTDEFLVDLSRLSEKGPFEIGGRRLDLQQTKDTNQGMLLHGAAGRGYVGFVVFKEA